jgi:hypothetical protein
LARLPLDVAGGSPLVVERGEVPGAAPASADAMVTAEP